VEVGLVRFDLSFLSKELKVTVSVRSWDIIHLLDIFAIPLLDVQQATVECQMSLLVGVSAQKMVFV